MKRCGTFAFAAALFAAFAGAPVAQAQARVVIRRAPADSARTDSMFAIRVNVRPGDVMRLAGELMASRQMEERLAMSLREANLNDATRARDIELQLSAIARRNASLASVIRLQCERDDMQPEGYMGVNFVSVTPIEVQRTGRGPAMYIFGDSTRIVSVDPGSPAQKAGLEVDDQLVAIAGHEASKPIPLGAVLKPGARINVRVSRGGQQRDVSMLVGTRPEGMGSPCAGIDDVITSSRWAPQIWIMRRGSTEGSSDGGSGAAAGGFNSVRPRSPDQPRQGGGTFAFVTPFATAGNFIGGAQLLTLDADWRETVGVDRGLLVLMVASGTPAEAAGLRKGDVIVAAGDSTITSPVTLWRMVNQSGPKGVTLKVQRAKQPVVVVLKMREPQ